MSVPVKTLAQTFLLIIAVVAMSAPATALEPRSGVVLRALDKITGNSTDLQAQIGKTIKFGRLEITPRACFQAPPQDTPESAAFLEIASTAPPERERLPGGQAETEDASPARTDGKLFAGWMYASSPGLNALEHPTYDIWVISCKAAAP